MHFNIFDHIINWKFKFKWVSKKRKKEKEKKRNPKYRSFLQMSWRKKAPVDLLPRMGQLVEYFVQSQRQVGLVEGVCWNGTGVKVRPPGEKRFAQIPGTSITFHFGDREYTASEAKSVVDRGLDLLEASGGDKARELWEAKGQAVLLGGQDVEGQQDKSEPMQQQQQQQKRKQQQQQQQQGGGGGTERARSAMMSIPDVAASVFGADKKADWAALYAAYRLLDGSPRYEEACLPSTISSLCLP